MIPSSRTNEAVQRFTAVLDRDEFRAKLDRLFPSRDKGRRQIRLAVLKGHKDRCTFETSVQTRDGWRSVIAKVYETDRSDVFETMRAVAGSDFGSDAEFAIPEPIDYLRPLNILLEERVRGTQVMEIAVAGSPPEQVAAMERCGTWLAHFHANAPRLRDTRTPEELIARCRFWTDQIRDFGGSLSTKADAAVQKLEDALPHGDGLRLCASHGSFMPEHVILSGTRTVTIDLDEYGIADPAYDMAWFIVSLERLGLKQRGTLRAHDVAVEAFVRAYASHAVRDVRLQLPFYKGVECMHRAFRDLRKRVPSEPEWADRMLDEALLSL